MAPGSGTGAAEAAQVAADARAAAGSWRVASTTDTVFTWDYAVRSPVLARLAAQGRAAQWDPDGLAWDTPVDQEAVAVASLELHRARFGDDRPTDTLAGTPLAAWGEDEWLRYGIESQNWTLSQFLHGEQGALLCTARIIETAPDLDAKYVAATQVLDEARHTEVFARYLDTKLSGHYPVNPHLQELLGDVVADARWDVTYLGMQIMVEGLALAAFGYLSATTPEPLLRQLLRAVMADEARHVAFGIAALQAQYRQLTTAELHERQVLAYEHAVRIRDRFLQQEVWERMGVDLDDILPVLRQAPRHKQFQQALFSKIVPCCGRLGLLDAADGWLRHRFEELDVIHLEHLDPFADAVATTPAR